VTTFAPIFAPPALSAAVGDDAWVGAMLEVERALVEAETQLGLVPAEAAALVAASCRPEHYDVQSIVEHGRLGGNPVEPLVRAVRDRTGPEGADWVHWGTTSQDVLDSAAMLVSRTALDMLLPDVDAVASACAALAEAYRSTPMAARTLLQQAVPTSFGLKAAGWLVAVLDARALLVAVRRDGLAVQLGGAAGTLGMFGETGPELVRLVATELGLAQPTLPWHTNRVRVAELGSALAITAGVAGKIGLDISLLAQTEVGEVAEPAGAGRGRSSTMPHKHNPIGSVLTVACARGAAAAAATLTQSMLQEHERAAGAWHAEWDALSRALLYAGGAVSSIRHVLEGLQVFPERMRDNLHASGGVPLAEQVSFRLAEHLGRVRAQQIMTELAGHAATGGATLREALLADERVTAELSAAEIEAALEPAAALEAAGPLVDRALERFRGENA
jgi:3-carboxy-cis,cis-muconate cycloisomerase